MRKNVKGYLIRRCRCSGTSKSRSEVTTAGGGSPPPVLFRGSRFHVDVWLSVSATARHDSGDAGGCGLHLPDAAAYAIGSCGDHRRRQCHHRTGGADPQPARSRSSHDRAVLHLVGQGAERRFRRELLLQEDGRPADRRAHRADAVAGLLHDFDRGVRRRSARRAGGTPARLVDRPHRDGLFGARLFRAGVRDRLSPDLSVRGLAELAAGAGLSADRGRASAAGCSG